MMYEGNLFISYASADKAEAEALALRDWLQGEGWSRLFLDLDEFEEIKAGSRRWDELANAMRRSDAVLALVSPSWAASKWCLAELNVASLQHKPVLACIIKPLPSEDIPSTPSVEWQFVDLTWGVLDHRVDVACGGEKPPVSVAFSAAQLGSLKMALQTIVQDGVGRA